MVQMQAPTAQRILREAGYGDSYDIDYLRSKLTHDDEFAIALAALHLRLDLDKGMTEKEAYLAYSVDQDASENLMEPAKDGVQTNPALSERSARYDANLRAINQAGDLVDYYDIDALPEPTYGNEGAAGGDLFEPALAPLPLGEPPPPPPELTPG
jgi:hypothetical protein